MAQFRIELLIWTTVEAEDEDAARDVGLKIAVEKFDCPTPYIEILEVSGTDK